jgi:hypothetical protein
MRNALHPSLPTDYQMHPETSSPWPAVSLTLASAAILGTVAVMIGTLSVKPGAWMLHGLATGLLVLAAGMALGPRRWQECGINVAAWVLGFSLGLSLATLWSVGMISLIVVIFLFASLVLWPRAAGTRGFGWTQVWYETLGFLAFLIPMLVLLPTM